MMVIIGIVIFSLYMEYAMWIRVPRYLSGLNNFIKYVELEPIEKCLDYIQDYKLADFYVASSARSYLSGFQHDDYATEKATEKILRAGARFLEFEIFDKGNYSIADAYYFINTIYFLIKNKNIDY